MFEKRYQVQYLAYASNPHIAYWDCDWASPAKFWTQSSAVLYIAKQMKKSIRNGARFTKYRILDLKSDNKVIYTIVLRAPTKEK